MKFLLWFIKTAIVHIVILLAMLVIAMTWEAGLDKTVSLSITLIILLVLIVGKLYYYHKNVK